MTLPCEIPQLDIPDVGRNHILFFLFQLVKSFQYKEFIQTACLIQCLVNMYQGGYGIIEG